MYCHNEERDMLEDVLNEKPDVLVEKQWNCATGYSMHCLQSKITIWTIATGSHS
jgi:hypothetical protein